MLNIEKLMDYEQHPDMVTFIKSLIPLEDCQGRKQVPNAFIHEYLSLDPIKFSHKILGDDKDGDKGHLALELSAIHLKKAVLNEISKINYDFNAKNSTWDEYLSGVKMLGFEEILRHEDDKKTEIMFKHSDYTLIWVVDSYTSYNGEKSVNGSSLYFNLTVKKGKELDYTIPMSRGYHNGTEIIQGDLDMRTMPSYYLSSILTAYDIVDNWIEYSVHTKHLSTKEQIEKIDDEILDKLFKRVSRFYKFKNKDLCYHIKTEFYEKTEAFYNSLTEEEHKYIYFYSYFFKTKFGNCSFISDRIVEKAIAFGFTQEDLVYLDAQMVYFQMEYAENSDILKPWDNQEQVLELFNKNELKELLNLCKNSKDDEFVYNEIPSEIIEKIKKSVD